MAWGNSPVKNFKKWRKQARATVLDAMLAPPPYTTKYETEILAEETPDICASAEPGMKPEEIEKFKRELEIEYNKALKAVV